MTICCQQLQARTEKKKLRVYDDELDDEMSVCLKEDILERQKYAQEKVNLKNKKVN